MGDSIADLLFDFVRSDDTLEELCELLDSGVDPNYQRTYGSTPLHYAACRPEKNIKVVQELIKRGAEVNLSDHLSFTALHYAAMNRKRSLVRELIQSGASVNAKSFVGRTPLHLAILSCIDLPNFPAEPRILWYLLQHEDIDCNAKDNNGSTPITIAIRENLELATYLLLGKNANPNVTFYEKSESLLHVAFHRPQSWIEFDLLFHGASIYSVDESGQTPLEVLMKYGLDTRESKWMELIFKLVAILYSVTSDLKQKLEFVPHFSQFFNECCNEVDYMRKDIIWGNITMHDFVRSCYDENNFKNLLFQVHKPIVDILVRGTYPLYYLEILYIIPEFSLLTILQMAACSKKSVKGREKDLAELFTILDVIYLFSEYLSRVDIFCLIVAFSNVVIAKSMLNLQQYHLSYIFYLQSNVDVDLCLTQ